MKTKDAANKLAPVGAKITIDYYSMCILFHKHRAKFFTFAHVRPLDGKTIAIIVFTASDLISCVALKIVTLLIQDMYHTIPKCITRRLRILDKTLSTSTLGLQSICLAICTIFLIVPLCFFTVFAFTKEAKVVITKDGVALECSAIGPLDDLCLLLVYVEIPYSEWSLLFRISGSSNADPANLCSLVRFGALLPWAIVLLGVVGTLVTFVAWRKRPQPMSDMDTVPSADTSITETAVGDESLPHPESKEKDLEAIP
jgi:hypothetical protein